MRFSKKKKVSLPFIFSVRIRNIFLCTLVFSLAQAQTQAQIRLACTQCCSQLDSVNFLLSGEDESQCSNDGCLGDTTCSSFLCSVGRNFRNNQPAEVRRDANGDLAQYECNLDTGELIKGYIRRQIRCDGCCEDAGDKDFFTSTQSVDGCKTGCVEKASCPENDISCLIGLAFRDRSSFAQIDNNQVAREYTCLSSGRVEENVVTGDCVTCCESIEAAGFLQPGQLLQSCKVPGCFERDCSSSGMSYVLI